MGPGGVSSGEDRFGTGDPTDTMRRFVLYHYNGLEDPGRKPVCVTVNVSQIDDSSGSGASGVASPPSPHPVPYTARSLSNLGEERGYSLLGVHDICLQM